MTVFDSIRNAIPPLHREGMPFVIGAAIITLILFLIWAPLGWIGAIVTAWVFFFFRDPVRTTPIDPSLAVSPADGKITAVDYAIPPLELGLGDEPLLRISVFLNIFDVHVNRTPVAGRVARIAYRPGKFFNAELDKASEFNERNGLVIETLKGTVGVVQIAGLIARRIVCFTQENAELDAGERFGLIRFGSRVDTYLPKGSVPVVSVGQRAVAGETVLADLDGKPETVRSYRTH
jgi:phosphatidylserine decarboxylase